MCPVAEITFCITTLVLPFWKNKDKIESLLDHSKKASDLAEFKTCNTEYPTSLAFCYGSLHAVYNLRLMISSIKRSSVPLLNCL